MATSYTWFYGTSENNIQAFVFPYWRVVVAFRAFTGHVSLLEPLVAATLYRVPAEDLARFSIADIFSLVRSVAGPYLQRADADARYLHFSAALLKWSDSSITLEQSGGLFGLYTSADHVPPGPANPLVLDQGSQDEIPAVSASSIALPPNDPFLLASTLFDASHTPEEIAQHLFRARRYSPYILPALASQALLRHEQRGLSSVSFCGCAVLVYPGSA